MSFTRTLTPEPSEALPSGHSIESVPMKTASIRADWEGRTIDGRFPLLEWLGGSTDRGVFLTVMQGIQTATIKLIRANDADAAAYLSQWERAKALSHPHLMQIFETDRFAGGGTNLVCVVTERAEESLAQVISESPLNAVTARKVLDAILDALAYVHAKGFVHGDLKPANVLNVFGEWKISGEDLLIPDADSNLVRESGPYAAPELETGTPSAASDTWSLGMTLFEALTQRPLVWDQSARGGPIIPESVPQPFLDIVRGCTRFDPAQRCIITDIKARLAREKSMPEAVPADQIPIGGKPARGEPDALSISEAFVPAAPEPLHVAPDRVDDVERHESEPELFPRPLFGDIEEERRHSSWGPVILGVLILLAVAGVYLTRDRWMKTASHAVTKIVPEPAPAPAPTAPPETPTQSPSQNAQQSQPSATSQSESQTAPATGQAAPPETKAQNPPATEQAAPQSQPPAAPTPKGQTAPATGESAPPVEVTESHGTSEGAVERRVLPRPSPSATSHMRGPVNVAIHASVNSSGSVSNATYISPGPGNYFARISLEAARSWKFKPPRMNGRSNPSAWTLHFTFRPERIEATATQTR